MELKQTEIGKSTTGAQILEQLDKPFPKSRCKQCKGPTYLSAVRVYEELRSYKQKSHPHYCMNCGHIGNDQLESNE